MTQKEFICKIADFCGQRVYFRDWDNYYHCWKDSDKPTVMQAEQGWERNKRIYFDPTYFPANGRNVQESGFIYIYCDESDRAFVITHEADKFYLQENHANGDITYFVDGTKSIRAIYNAIRKEIPQAINL